MNIKRAVKFVLLTAVCYLLLAFNVFHIGEKLVPKSKNYLKEHIPSEDKEIEESFFDEISVQLQYHGSAETRYEHMTTTLCKRTKLCDKISLQGTYNAIDTYTYTRGSIALIEFIDQNRSKEKEIKNVIEKIEIYQDTGSRRWYATRNNIILNLWSVESKKEFAELLTHEMWHIKDLWYLQWENSKKDKAFTEFGKIVFAIDDPSFDFYRISRNSETIRKAEAKKKDFCSGYGMTNPFEDFAECFNLYLNHNSLFREIAKNNNNLSKKYNTIARRANGKYMASRQQEIDIVKDNASRRPRDTTRIQTN